MLKMTCPSCGGHVEFQTKEEFSIVPCPHCGKEMRLASSVFHVERFAANRGHTDEIPRLIYPYDSIDSGIASALTFFAVLDFIAAVIGGFIEGINGPDGDDGNAWLGWLVFICGVFSGLVLLGFARIVKRVFECSQRLERIETIFEKFYRDKK